MKIHAAIVQFQPGLGEMDSNLEKVSGLLDGVAGADLVILPELASSGYNFRSLKQATECAEVPGEGPFSRLILDKARQLKSYIVAGIDERSEQDLYNTAIIAGPEGLLGKYRKIHLFMNEKDIFLPGDSGLPVFELGGWKIGIQICFDYLFPETWRILAQKGADVICHPSNLLTSNAHKCIPGLALMNRIFIATANRTGQEGDLLFSGQSFFTDPRGDVLATAGIEREEILHQELDISRSRDKMVTPRNHAFDDRRPETYHP